MSKKEKLDETSVLTAFNDTILRLWPLFCQSSGEDGNSHSHDAYLTAQPDIAFTQGQVVATGAQAGDSASESVLFTPFHINETTFDFGVPPWKVGLGAM